MKSQDWIGVLTRFRQVTHGYSYGSGLRILTLTMFLTMNIANFKKLLFMSSCVGTLVLLNNQAAYAEVLVAAPQFTETLESAVGSVSLEAEALPTPGTVQTTAASLQAETLTAQTTTPLPQTTPEATPQTTPEVPPTETAPQTPSTPEIAPTPQTTPTPQPVIDPGRATRSGPSYIGVGGNIGFGGRTDLGRGSFTVFSKIGLTNTLSFRPALNVSRRPAILLPVTFDFPLRSAIDGRVLVAPFVGGGAVISTGSGSVLRGLVTGGVDIPISDQFTANAAVNVGFFGRTEVGLRLGVGYNF